VRLPGIERLPDAIDVVHQNHCVQAWPCSIAVDSAPRPSVAEPGLMNEVDQREVRVNNARRNLG